MTNEDIFARMKPIIVDHLGVEEHEVTLDADIRDDLGADSLDVTELCMAFDEEFGFTKLMDPETPDIFIIRDFIAHVQEQVQPAITATVKSVMASVLKIGMDKLKATRTLESLDIDSLHIPEMALGFEEAFAGIAVSDEDVCPASYDTVTVLSIIAMVADKVEALPALTSTWLTTPPAGKAPRLQPSGSAP